MPIQPTSFCILLALTTIAFIWLLILCYAAILWAVLWGVLMTFLSMLPAVGAVRVWAPAAIWFFLMGPWGKGVILIAVGELVIGLIHNLLRPPLVGAGTRLPDYVVLISTVGGMSLFGIDGFVIGPLIAALFISSWSRFPQEQVEEKHHCTA